MADRESSIVTNSNLLSTLFEKSAIATLNETVHYYRLARKFRIPRGEGVTQVFSGWRRISAPSSTLDEMSANAAVVLSSRKVSATIGKYGRHFKISSLLELASVLDPNQGAQSELMQTMKLTLDNVCQLAIFQPVLVRVGQLSGVAAALSATNFRHFSSMCADTGTTASGVVRFGLPVLNATSCVCLSSVGSSTISISARPGPIGIRKGVYRLHRLSAPKYANGRYVGVAGPQFFQSMWGNPDFKSWVQGSFDGAKETLMKDAVGSIHGVELYMGQNQPRYAGSAVSALPLTILGDGCLGVTELESGESLGLIIKPSNSGGVANPYNLYGTVAFKINAVAAILNTSAGVIVQFNEKL